MVCGGCARELKGELALVRAGREYRAAQTALKRADARQAAGGPARPALLAHYRIQDARGKLLDAALALEDADADEPPRPPAGAFASGPPASRRAAPGEDREVTEAEYAERVSKVAVALTLRAARAGTIRVGGLQEMAEAAAQLAEHSARRIRAAAAAIADEDAAVAEAGRLLAAGAEGGGGAEQAS